MSDRTGTVGCRAARSQFGKLAAADSGRTLTGVGMSAAEQQVIQRHLNGCERCAREYQFVALERGMLDLAGAPEPIEPGHEFFNTLRARLAPGLESRDDLTIAGDESWAAAVMLIARQLIPAMAMLLLLILGATFVLGNRSNGAPSDLSSVRPTERILFSDVYELSRPPTTDDVLETLVAVEEIENGN